MSAFEVMLNSKQIQKLLSSKRPVHLSNWKLLNSKSADPYQRLQELEKLLSTEAERFEGFIQLGGLSSLLEWIELSLYHKNYIFLERVLNCVNYEGVEISLKDLEDSNLGMKILELYDSLSLPQKVKDIAYKITIQWKKKISTEKEKPKTTKLRFQIENQLTCSIRYDVLAPVSDFAKKLVKSKLRPKSQNNCKVEEKPPPMWNRETWAPEIVESLNNLSRDSEDKLVQEKRDAEHPDILLDSCSSNNISTLPPDPKDEIENFNKFTEKHNPNPYQKKQNITSSPSTMSQTEAVTNLLNAIAPTLKLHPNQLAQTLQQTVNTTSNIHSVHTNPYDPSIRKPPWRTSRGRGPGGYRGRGRYRGRGFRGRGRPKGRDRYRDRDESFRRKVSKSIERAAMKKFEDRFEIVRSPRKRKRPKSGRNRGPSPRHRRSHKFEDLSRAGRETKRRRPHPPKRSKSQRYSLL